MRLVAENLCTLALVPGDVLVLASDGLWAHGPDNQIDSTGETSLPWLQTQLDAALAAGSSDNLTAITLRCK